MERVTKRVKKIWIRNIKYALKTKTNPLALNKTQRKIITEKIKNVSGKNAINQHRKTLKKYKNRKSPPYPANENCNKKMVGNDGQNYILRWNEEDSTWQNVSTVNNLGSFPVNENPTEYADGQTYTQVIKRDNYNEPLKEVWSYVGVVGNEHTFRLTSIGFTKYQTKSDIAGTGSKFKYIKIYDPKGLYQPPKYCTLRAQGQFS